VWDSQIAEITRWKAVFGSLKIDTSFYISLAHVMAATFASAMTALLGSVTRPAMDPFVECARRTAGNEEKNRSRRTGITRMFKTQRRSEKN
jgi:hypothetical protein